jgi:hypothetical protein
MGIKVIIGFHVISFLLWSFGQTGAVVAYDTVAAWGFQDPRVLLDPAIVEVNRGIGLADTLVMLPLFVVAVIGLLRRRFFGAMASWLVFGMTLYWPTVFWCSQFFYAQGAIKHQPTAALTIVLPAALMLIAVWGSWYLASTRHQFR